MPRIISQLLFNRRVLDTQLKREGWQSRPLPHTTEQWKLVGRPWRSVVPDGDLP